MQEAIVAAIVAYAAFVVAKRYTPKALRRALRIGVARTAQKIGWSSLAGKIEDDIQAATAGTCGGCSGCADTPAKKTFSITPEALRRTASLINKKSV